MLNPEVTKVPKLFDVLIIGGGLSGLMVAHQIHRTLPSTSWKLLEARPLLGGRLANDITTNQIDLGGAWIWPQQQSFMRKLASDLRISTFQQPDDSSSTRIDGGAVQFIHALARDLPSENIVLNAPVTKCLWKNETTTSRECSAADYAYIEVHTPSETILARRVVVAAPPKLVSKHISFEPALSNEKERAMSASQTWMAGVTKISLQYPSRFWNADSSNMGLPGGPAFQVYDASTKDGSIAALTFFCMVPQSSPAIDSDSILAGQVAAQISKVWHYYGQKDMAKQATSFIDVHVKRWPLEQYISEDPKPNAVNPHPHVVPALSRSEWNDQLLFAGSEADRGSPGVMEGAVSSAMRVVYDLQAWWKQQS